MLGIARVAALGILWAITVVQGSKRDRAIASAFVIATLLEDAVPDANGPGMWRDLPIMIEMTEMIALSALAIISDRQYPLWIGGGQIIVVIFEAISTVSIGSWEAACRMIVEWGHGVQFAALAVGVVVTWKRKRSMTLRTGQA